MSRTESSSAARCRGRLFDAGRYGPSRNLCGDGGVVKPPPAAMAARGTAAAATGPTTPSCSGCCAHCCCRSHCVELSSCPPVYRLEPKGLLLLLGLSHGFGLGTFSISVPLFGFSEAPAGKPGWLAVASQRAADPKRHRHCRTGALCSQTASGQLGEGPRTISEAPAH